MPRKTLRPTGSLGTILKNRIAAIALRRTRISGILPRVRRFGTCEQAGAFPCCALPCCMHSATAAR